MEESNVNDTVKDADESGDVEFRDERMKVRERSYRNFLQDKRLQFTYGLYFLLFALFFATILGTIFYLTIEDIFQVIVALTDVQEEAITLFNEGLSKFAYVAIAFLVVFSLGSFVFAIIITHRIVGPIVAFQKHIFMILNGNYSHRTTLRSNDHMVPIAKGLNKISEKLEKGL